MTHSIDAPLPPPPSSGATGYGDTSTTSTTTTTSGSPSTTDVAKDEARNVGQTAKQAGSQVATTAADQAKNVVAETKQQAQSLLDQGRTQVRQQAVSQQQKAGQSLSSLAGQLRGMVEGNAPAPGPARDLLQQGASKVEEFATLLQNREPADLLDEVRSFARRKPGTFLLGAALAGILAGRLTSGVKAAHSNDSSSSGRSQLASTPSTYSSGSNYVDPAPTYTGYESAVGRLPDHRRRLRDDHRVRVQQLRDDDRDHRHPAAAPAVRHRAAGRQRRAADRSRGLGRPDPPSGPGGLSRELSLLRRHAGGWLGRLPARAAAAELRRDPRLRPERDRLRAGRDRSDRLHPGLDRVHPGRRLRPGLRRARR